MPTQITINSERPRGGASCAKCAHLRTGEGAIYCAVDGPLQPCEQFKDASVDRTFRRSLCSHFHYFPRFVG